jgi:Galactose oxidase, central domain
MNRKSIFLLPIKTLLFAVTSLFLTTSCDNKEEVKAFSPPSIEATNVYSISETTAEASVDVLDVQAELNVGIVWAERTNPTTADNSQVIEAITDTQTLQFVIPNLQRGKTYYLRAYYTQNGQTIYSNELSFVQNNNGEWTRLASPKLSFNEYISPDDVDAERGGNNSVICYKVNRQTNNSIAQIYYRDFDAWNPNFYNRLPTNPAPRQMLYNPIRVRFDGGATPLTLYGIGYQQAKPTVRMHLKTIAIIESNGSWEPYPGADVATVSFGIGKYVYVCENQANGKVWRFDYSVLKWTEVARVPMTKVGRMIAFDAGERAFVLVESANWQDPVRELYEYIPGKATWERRADFTGENRRYSSGFVINGRMFFGLGQSTQDYRGLRDLWSYQPSTNTWSRASDYPGGGTLHTFVSSLSSSALIGFGQQARRTAIGSEDYRQANDFWAFRPK